MSYCVNCLFQGDNGPDEKGNGRVFCLVKKKWLPESSSCENFTEYADLSKEIRSKYAFEIRKNNIGESKTNWAIKQNWKAMLITLILSFAMFVITVKFFDKYIF
jgi:hypothetical protein